MSLFQTLSTHINPLLIQKERIHPHHDIPDIYKLTCIKITKPTHNMVIQNNIGHMKSDTKQYILYECYHRKFKNRPD